MTSIHPVILSGGIGSRLWPLSRSLTPKQLLPLAGENTLIQNTVLRVKGPDFAPPLIVCQAEHRFLIAEQVRTAGIVPAGILLEPAGRNTASAIAVAALTIHQNEPHALMLVLPADHVVGDLEAFDRAIAAAKEPAHSGKLVTFGIVPTHPETGYGYIQRGAALENMTAYAVARFVEKPDQNAAERYLASGDYWWNSGMFLMRADAFLSELERLEPDMLKHCRAAVAHGTRDADFFRLGAEFADNRSVSVDYAVMERTGKAVVVPAPIGWNDIGSWAALWDVSLKDTDGNVARGPVIQRETRNSYLRSEGPLVAALGLTGITVVATPDAVLVCSKDRAQDVRAIVERLEESGSSLHHNHPRMALPWGSHENIASGDGFKVKHIVVNPGAKISLRPHRHHAQHWTVVSGEAIVGRETDSFPLKVSQGAFIPPDTTHWLENPGATPLQLIEVQCGLYPGEDDTARFQND